MNFNLYNILSHLVSGFLVYIAGLYFLDLKPDHYDPLIATAIAYILGYFINTIGAWIEWLLNWSWEGRPSDQLLTGKKCGRIYFSEHKKVRELLKKKIGNKKPSTDNLFKLAMRLANKERGYYFAKEVLNVALNILEKN